MVNYQQELFVWETERTSLQHVEQPLLKRYQLNNIRASLKFMLTESS